MNVVQRKLARMSSAPRPNPVNGEGVGCSCGSLENQLVQGGAIVRCQECAPSKMFEFFEKFLICQAAVRITCASKRYFIVDPDTRLVFFFDPASCLIDADPSPGGCPTASAPVYYDPCQDSIRADLPDGTYENVLGVWSKVEPCCTCVKRPVFYDSETPAFFTVPPLDVLDIAVTTTLCPPA